LAGLGWILGKKNMMSGLDDLLAASNDRWSRAMRNAKDVEDTGLGHAVKTYYTRWFPAGVLAAIAVGAVAAMLGIADALAGWGTYVVVGLLLATAGSIIGGLVYNAKKVAPAARLYWADVLFPLESEERKHVKRQIAGKAAIDHEHLPVARAGAVQLRKSLATQLVLMPSYFFMFASQAANQAVRGEPLLAGIMATAVGGSILGMALMVRDFRRTSRFLAGTSEE
jgi:hypothetical protein